MSKRSKGVKLGLGEFLGDSRGYTLQDALPTGPRVYDNDDGQYQSRRGGRHRDPHRSEQVDQWRGSRDQNDNRRDNRRYGDSDNVSNWRRGGGDRFERRQYDQRDDTPVERPSRMKLQLKPRSTDAPPAPSGHSVRGDPFGGARPVASDESSQKSDKWSNVFSRSRNDYRSSNKNDNESRRENSADSRKPKETKVEQISGQLKQTTLKETNDKSTNEDKIKRQEDERLASEKAKEAEEEAKKKEKEQAEFDEKSQIAIDLVLQSGKRGKDLTSYAKKVFDQHVLPTGAKLLSSILYATNDAKENSSWASLEEFGDLLVSTIGKSDPKTEQIKSLYALQRYFHSISFPKGLLERVFIELYNNEIIDEDAFLAYKYDVDDDTPGKIKAIIQTTQWLTWLETAPEEEEDEEDEEDFDLDEPLMTL